MDLRVVVSIKDVDRLFTHKRYLVQKKVLFWWVTVDYSTDERRAVDLAEHLAKSDDERTVWKNRDSSKFGNGAFFAQIAALWTMGMAFMALVLCVIYLAIDAFLR